MAVFLFRYYEMEIPRKVGKSHSPSDRFIGLTNEGECKKPSKGSTWLDESTRNAAIDKLDVMTFAQYLWNLSPPGI